MLKQYNLNGNITLTPVPTTKSTPSFCQTFVTSKNWANGETKAILGMEPEREIEKNFTHTHISTRETDQQKHYRKYEC